MYQIIEIETAGPVCEGGIMLQFSEIGATLNYIQELSAKTFKKYKPQIIVNDSWVRRDTSRFATGQYKEPNWLNYAFSQTTKTDALTSRESMDFLIDHKDYAPADWVRITAPVGHFVHVSEKDPTKIAFTETPEKGMQDRQTQQNVASYLQQYCNIDQNLARFVAMQHVKTYGDATVVLWADTADEIAHVYAFGPNSCMGGYDINKEKRKDDSYFASFCHPVRVYGDSDFRLAYIKDETGKITARTLVVKDSNYYLRLYGDEERLGNALKLQRFCQNYDAMEGKKIRKIWDDFADQWVLPYLDGIQSIDSRNDENFHIITTDNPDNIANCQNGFGEEYQPGPWGHCENCEDSIQDEDDSRQLYVGRYDFQTVCNYCARTNGFRCYESNDRIHNDYGVEIDGNMFAEWCAPDYNYCERGEVNTTQSVAIVWTNETEKEYWSDNAIADHAFKCRIDGKTYCNRLLAIDSWNDEPRAIFNIPDDMPADASGFEYRCHNNNQQGFAI